MDFILQVSFLCLMILIFYQDVKDRKVLMLLFVLGIVIGGYLHIINSFLEIFWISITINFLIILFIGTILLLYVKFKLKRELFTMIGVGDFLFFLLIAISFPTFSFLILFSISLIFSLVLFLFIKHKLKLKTVPLAGFQALFLSIVLITNSVFKIVNLYAY